MMNIKALEAPKYDITVIESNAMRWMLPLCGTFLLLIFGIPGISGQHDSLRTDSMPKTNQTHNQYVRNMYLPNQAISHLPYQIQDVDVEWARPHTLHLAGALPGKVAGLTMLQGQSGASKDWWINLRGPKSLNQSQQPLIIVDGIPVRQGWEMIGQQDIESIRIITSGLGTALYGSQGQNGAIVVETKSEDKQSVVYSQRFGLDIPVFLIPFQKEYGQGYDNEYISRSTGAWGPPLDGREVEHWSPDPAFANVRYLFKPQYDFRDFVRNGRQWSHHLTVYGADGPVNSSLSLQYLNANGLLPNNDLKRYGAMVKLGRHSGHRFQWQTKLQYLVTHEDNALPTGDSRINPYRFAYQVPPNIANEDLAKFEYVDNESNVRQNFWNPGDSRNGNPYWTLHRNTNEVKNDLLMSMVQLKYILLPILDIQFSSGLNMGQQDFEEKLYNDTYIVANDGRFSLSKSRFQEWFSRLALSLNSNIGEDFHVSSALGISSFYEKEDMITANTGKRLIIPNFFNLENTNDAEVDNGLLLRRQLLGAYLWTGVSWKNLLRTDLSMRGEWSSSLPTESRPQYYPSIAAAWSLSESFHLPSWIENLDIRGGWSKTGNPFPSFKTFRRLEVQPDRIPGFIRPDDLLVTHQPLPETTLTREWGLDVDLFQQRIQLALTAYHAKTKDHLLTQSAPVGAGGSEQQINAGIVTNRGIELGMGMNLVKKNDFNWHVQINATRNKNKVSDLQRAGDTIWLHDHPGGFGHIEGLSWGQILSHWSLKKDQQGNLLMYESGSLAQVIGWHSVGGTLPDLMIGIQQSFLYRRWKLMMSLDMRKGGHVLSITDHTMTVNGLSTTTLPGRVEGLIVGQDILSEYTVLDESGRINERRTTPEGFWHSTTVCCDPLSEFYTKEATNARLRQFILTHTIPIGTAKTHRYLKLSVMAHNLINITNKAEIIDPQVRASTNIENLGLEFFAPPPVRSFSFQVELGL